MKAVWQMVGAMIIPMMTYACKGWTLNTEKHFSVKMQYYSHMEIFGEQWPCYEDTPSDSVAVNNRWTTVSQRGKSLYSYCQMNSLINTYQTSLFTLNSYINNASINVVIKCQ